MERVYMKEQNWTCLRYSVFHATCVAIISQIYSETSNKKVVRKRFTMGWIPRRRNDILFDVIFDANLSNRILSTKTCFDDGILIQVRHAYLAYYLLHILLCVISHSNITCIFSRQGYILENV